MIEYRALILQQIDGCVSLKEAVRRISVHLKQTFNYTGKAEISTLDVGLDEDSLEAVLIYMARDSVRINGLVLGRTTAVREPDTNQVTWSGRLGTLCSENRR